MLKISLFLRKIQISQVNNSRIPRINNAKFSEFFLHEPEHIVKFLNLH